MALRSERFDFPNGRGHTLAGRLERPEGETRACALFAHCFTCGMNVHAATRVARGLAERGIATLRFDFTGLGSSEGEFANETFTGNVGDLVAAANHLEREVGPARILVGHSLGGAAVLAAALELPDVRLVATIGAPADPTHALQTFADHLDHVEEHGYAEVHLGGQPFRIGRSFFEDLGRHDLAERLAALRCAVLVLHSPQDEIVELDEATRIYRAAPHPKSFVSLDGADHLLTRPEDARFVADLVCTFAARYVD